MEDKKRVPKPNYGPKPEDALWDCMYPDKSEIIPGIEQDDEEEDK